MSHRDPKEKRGTPKLWSDVAIGTPCPCGGEAHREPANTHVLLQHWHWDPVWGTWHSAHCFLCLLPQSLNRDILLISSEFLTVFLSNPMKYRQWHRKQVSEGLHRWAFSFFPILVWKCWKECNYLYCIGFESEDTDHSLLISFFQVHPLFSKNYKNSFEKVIYSRLIKFKCKIFLEAA